MRRRRSGISAVVGTAIGIMIFFTVVIPMWIYMQNVQTLFMDEVSRRLRFEVEKLNENIVLTASIQPPEIHPFARSRLYILIYNRSPVEVSVPVLYVESSKIGLQRVDKNYKLAPGEMILEPVFDYIIEPDEVVIIRAPTLRGNSFVSNEIGPNRLPYMLLVQLSNSSFGYWYGIQAKVVLGGDVNKVVGCVSLRTDEFAAGCKGTAEVWKYVSSPDDLNIVAGFNVAPGLYQVNVMQCRQFKTDCVDVPPGPVPVEIKANTIVEVGARSTIEVQKPIPLKVTPLLQLLTVVTKDNITIVNIPFMVMLGNNTEPLFNIIVNIEYLVQDNLTVTPLPPTTITINRLTPGEAFYGVFMASVDDSGSKGTYGGFFNYSLSLSGAQGQVTRINYIAADFGTPTAVGAVVVCRWWASGNVTMTSCRSP